jgi:hypothetical protein
MTAGKSKSKNGLAFHKPLCMAVARDSGRSAAIFISTHTNTQQYACDHSRYVIFSNYTKLKGLCL